MAPQKFSVFPGKLSNGLVVRLLDYSFKESNPLGSSEVDSEISSLQGQSNEYQKLLGFNSKKFAHSGSAVLKHFKPIHISIPI